MNHYDAVIVNGVLLRLSVSGSKLWVRRCDLAKALKCSLSSVVNQLLNVGSEHQKDDGFKLIDETAAKVVCLFIPKASGSKTVLKWLMGGGMGLPQTCESSSSLQDDGQIPTSAKPLDCSYCRNLTDAFLQHASEDEVKRFVQLVECEVAGILARHPSEELNDARHDLYRRFYLQGGEK